MRKIMLAATAIAGLGVLAAGSAQAQMSAVTSGMAAPAAGVAAPGTMNVFVKGKVETGFSLGSDSGSGGVKTVNGTTAKLNATDIMTFMRLYFGFDGALNNGLQYGSLVEVRQFYNTQNSALASSSANPMQVRRERVYVGTAQAGRLYMGTTDGPLSTMIVGDFGATAFDTEGGFVGSVGAYTRSPGTRLSYPFAGNSWEYMTNKIAYASPSYAGFDVGVSYEPNVNTGYGFTTNTGAYNATTTGTTTGTTSAVGTAGTRKNTVEAAVRYKGSFGPAAVQAEVGTMQGGTVGAYGAAVNNKAFSVYDAGLSVTVSNLTVAGHYMGGAVSAGDGSVVSGAKNSQFLEGGAMYTMGNLIVGASVINLLSDASTVAGKHAMLHEIGYTVGGTYTFAPGAAVFVSGIYGTRHQAGMDLLAGAAGASHNNTVERVLTTGAQFNF